ASFQTSGLNKENREWCWTVNTISDIRSGKMGSFGERGTSSISVGELPACGTETVALDVATQTANHIRKDNDFETSFDRARSVQFDRNLDGTGPGASFF